MKICNKSRYAIISCKKSISNFTSMCMFVYCKHTHYGIRTCVCTKHVYTNTLCMYVYGMYNVHGIHVYIQGVRVFVNCLPLTRWIFSPRCLFWPAKRDIFFQRFSSDRFHQFSWSPKTIFDQTLTGVTFVGRAGYIYHRIIPIMSNWISYLLSSTHRSFGLKYSVLIICQYKVEIIEGYICWRSI